MSIMIIPDLLAFNSDTVSIPLALVISATDLLTQHIEMQTEQGKKCLEMLLRGESIPEEVVTKMIEDKINSPEVIHHGEFTCIWYMLYNYT